MINMKIIKEKEPVGYTFDFIKSHSNTYKHVNSDNYFMSDGNGNVFLLMPISSVNATYIAKAIESVWENERFIEVDCSIVFTLPKKDENAIKN